MMLSATFLRMTLRYSFATLSLTAVASADELSIPAEPFLHISVGKHFLDMVTLACFIN